MLLPNADPVHKVTIIPRGRAGGYTLMLPKEDRSYRTRSELMDELKTLLAGRVSEEIILKEISTGAQSDIQRASQVVRSMITQYGMSDVLGPISFGEGQNHQVFLGRDINNQRNYSEEVACEIDKEVRKYIEDAYDECRNLLNEHIDKLHLIAQALIERETLDAKELKELMTNGKLSEKSEELEQPADHDENEPPLTPVESENHQVQASAEESSETDVPAQEPELKLNITHHE